MKIDPATAAPRYLPVADSVWADESSPLAIEEIVRHLARLAARRDYMALLSDQGLVHTLTSESEET